MWEKKRGKGGGREGIITLVFVPAVHVCKVHYAGIVVVLPWKDSCIKVSRMSVSNWMTLHVLLVEMFKPSQEGCQDLHTASIPSPKA